MSVPPTQLMTREVVHAKVVEILARVDGCDPVTISYEVMFGSLDRIEAMTLLEEEFRLTLPERFTEQDGPVVVNDVIDEILAQSRGVHAE